MPTIRILSDRVANQIAAGEVIERPAAVIKELVENALDAGADRIEVEFRHGGRSLMRVEDNGCGLTRDDALLALERHATSKLVETTDLDRLATFGFRGEALPSIASVSRFELQSRTAGAEAGTEVLVNGGKLVHVRECGVAPGTRITVSHLFNAVPARRKFLRTDATEAAHIVQTVRLYALACPQTAFTLVEDGRILFQSPVCTTLAERVTEIFGRQLADDLLALHATEDGLSLSGLIGRPGVNRAARHEMITFVNRRPVDSRTLNFALIESYATLVPKGRYPVAVLFLDVDPAAVDVNVHPAKREIRFRSEGQVRGFVIRTVLQKLRELGAPPPVVEMSSFPSPLLPIAPAPAALPAMVLPWRSGLGMPPASPLAAPTPSVAPPILRPAPPPETSSISPAPSSHATWRFLGVAHADTIVYESPGGLVLVDRRAAHERIWFERLRDEFARGAVASQRLLFPVPVELDAIASALLLDRLRFLAAHGLEAVEFGRNFFRIEAVPVWLDPDAAEVFLRDVLAYMREGRIDERQPKLADEELARLAAQKAVRLPDRIDERDALALIGQLFACSQPHTSPAGRPTHFELGRGELARRFQR
ncbi:MAG TPA: DNA mismatch repair endonuclease MutL [Candidatus Didemnitutus sp.]|jgi:DNA mismatch repair protein MutL